MSKCPECNLVGGCWCETAPTKAPLNLNDSTAYQAVIQRSDDPMRGWIDVTGDLTLPPVNDWSTLAELTEFIRSHGVALPVRWFESATTYGRVMRRGDLHTAVEFSSTLWPLLTPEQRFDTAAHELAHLLLPPSAGHNWQWKNKCRELGGSPTRTTALPEEVERAVSKWIGICPNNPEHRTYRRALTKKSRGRSCGKCSATWNPSLMFTWKELR